MPLNVDALETAINRSCEEKSFSGVVHVCERGLPIFSRAYGFADKSNARPNNIDTKFAVASGSKTFTATAICHLVDHGSLTFDTPLSDCLPGLFPHFDPNVTVHHLLSHSSGIPDYFDEEVMDDYGALWAERPMYNFRKPADFLPLFQQLPMKFAPSEHFAYNNAGYIVLGLIVERMSGMAYTEYVQKYIFDPCSMTDSGFYATDQLPENTAYGYLHSEDGGWRTNIFSVPVIGGADGGVFVTAPDMHRFWDALRNRRLLSDDSTRKMLTPHRRFTRNNGAYGYGVWMRLDGDIVHLYHAEGGDPGAEFISGVVESRGIDFSVIANTNGDLSEMVNLVITAG